jgi:hypothetical protein
MDHIRPRDGAGRRSVWYDRWAYVVLEPQGARGRVCTYRLQGAASAERMVIRWPHDNSQGGARSRAPREFHVHVHSTSSIADISDTEQQASGMPQEVQSPATKCKMQCVSAPPFLKTQPGGV